MPANAGIHFWLLLVVAFRAKSFRPPSEAEYWRLLFLKGRSWFDRRTVQVKQLEADVWSPGMDGVIVFQMQDDMDVQEAAKKPWASFSMNPISGTSLLLT